MGLLEGVIQIYDLVLLCYLRGCSDICLEACAVTR